MDVRPCAASLSGHTLCGTILSVAREKLVQAATEYRQIEADLVTARSALAGAIIEAAKAGMPQTEIIRISGYTREHVRRIIRSGGVGPEGHRPPKPDGA